VRCANWPRNSGSVSIAAAAFAFGLWLVSSSVAAQSDAVAAAFEAARSGNLQRLATLRPAAAEIPAVAVYLRDRNESLRREAVVVLARLGPPACPALTAALTDTSADMRERAARAIYHACSAVTADMPGLPAALRQSVRMGNASAAPLLLLGRFPDDETRAFLRGLLAAAGPMVKLENWNPPLPQTLAAAVGAVSTGVTEGAPVLQQGLHTVSQAEFLALVLGDIQIAGALRPLLTLLHDERPVSTGVPSGAEPRRRVCDLAMESFVHRLRLAPPFALRPPARYSKEERDQIEALARAAIGNG
jgi:HEAT repeat protein